MKEKTKSYKGEVSPYAPTSLVATLSTGLAAP